MNTKQRKPVPHICVADYVSHQIILSGKSQKDIADELGYDKPNIITMFKQGKTKVPINKVPEFAKVLGVDPIHFLRIALLEYSPSTWEVIEEVVGRSIVTENEMRIIKIVRDTSGGLDVAPQTDSEADDLKAVIAKWTAEADKKESMTQRVTIK